MQNMTSPADAIGQRLDQILEQQGNMAKALENIVKRLETMEHLLEDLGPKIGKVTEHVDFVEMVYDVVRNPINTLFFRSQPMQPRRLHDST